MAVQHLTKHVVGSEEEKRVDRIAGEEESMQKD